MSHQTRFVRHLRVALLSVAGSAALLVAGPLVAHALWDTLTPLGTQTLSTGGLGIDEDVLAGGTWTENGEPFDPDTDVVIPGATLVDEIDDVSVTAVGNNLVAGFKGTVTGADLGDADGHVTVTLKADPETIYGKDSGTDGTQSVDLFLTVETDSTLPTSGERLNLEDLTVTFANSYGGWTDTARLDAGTLTTGTTGGQLVMNFNLTDDADRTICFYLTDPDATVDWGYDGRPSGTQASAAEEQNCHTYPDTVDNSVVVTVTGTFAGLGSPTQDAGDIGALQHVNWRGDTATTSLAHAFQDAAHLASFGATDADLSRVTDFSYAFTNVSTSSTSPLTLNGLDTSNATTMTHMFDGAGNLNWWTLQNFDTADVVDMSSMFQDSSIATDDSMRSWKTGKVKNMSHMFDGATKFNSNITAWDTSHVTTMASMFEDATAFNQNINTNGAAWNVGDVTTMSRMFMNADSFAQNLPGWATKNVEDMSYMFADTAVFTQEIRPWNLAKVTTMAHMFENSHYNYFSLGAVGNVDDPDIFWDVSNVKDMSYMFAGSTYNQQLNAWDVSSVTKMESMFEDAKLFNQSIANWNTSNVTSFSKMFKGATAFNQDIRFKENPRAWDTAAAKNMSQMFQGATAFNQDIGNWNTANVDTMQNMFNGASAFNRDLSRWDVSGSPNHGGFNTGANAEWVGNADWQPRWGMAPAPTSEPTQTPSNTPTATDDATPPTTGVEPTTPTTDDPTQPTTEGDDSTPTQAPSSGATPSPTETAREEGTDQ